MSLVFNLEDGCFYNMRSQCLQITILQVKVLLGTQLYLKFIKYISNSKYTEILPALVYC